MSEEQAREIVTAIVRAWEVTDLDVLERDIVAPILARLIREVKIAALRDVAKAQCDDHRPYCSNFYPDPCPTNTIWDAIAALEKETA